VSYFTSGTLRKAHRLSRGTKSIYALTRGEITRGVANRFVHSRTYIFLYLGMAALSVTTVVLSLTDGCPGLAFYVLEVIINTAMILEVGVRFVALGKVRGMMLVGSHDLTPWSKTAILEISIQHTGPSPDNILRPDSSRLGFRKMRRRKQRGGNLRYFAAGSSKRSSIWAAGSCDEAVCITSFCSKGSR